jgi:hypothetical protein
MGQYLFSTRQADNVYVLFIYAHASKLQRVNIKFEIRKFSNQLP